MMNRVARVTMNDGRPVRTTIRPLSDAEAGASATIEMRIGEPDRQAPDRRRTIPMTIPAKPTIEPTDRSNSPAIISRATDVAMIPTWAATPTIVEDARDRQEGAAAAGRDSTAKTMKTKTTITRAPAAGLASSRWVSADLSQPLRSGRRARAGCGRRHRSLRSSRRRGRTVARPLQVAPDSPAHEAQVSAGPSPRGR